MRKILFIVLLLFCLRSVISLDIPITITNTQDDARTQVPVFLKLYDILGEDFQDINPQGFSVSDDAGNVPCDVYADGRTSKPGSMTLVFIVDSIAASETLSYVISYDPEASNDYPQIDYINTVSNLLQNPGFEEGTFLPEGYSASGDGLNWATQGSLSIDTSEKHSGKNSMKLTAGHHQMIRAMHDQKIHMQEAIEYELRFWSKADNMAYADTSTHSATELGGQVSDEYRSWQNGGMVTDDKFWHSWITPIAGTRDWMEYTKRIVAKKDKDIDFRWRFYQFEMEYMKYPEGTWWIDDALLYIPLKVTIDEDAMLSGIPDEFVFQMPVSFAVDDGFIPREHQLASRIRITAAKNEYEGAQFGIYSRTGGDYDITVEIDAENNLYVIDDYVLRPSASATIFPGTSKAFFIDFSPHDTPGTYDGKIIIRKGAQVVAELDLELVVPDVSLVRVDDHYMGTCMPYGERNLDPEIIENLAKTGYNFFSIFWHTGVCDDNSNLGTMFDKLKSNGMDVLGVMLFSDICRRACGGGTPQCGSAEKIASIEQSRIENNWPMIFYMTDDELFSKQNGDIDLQGLKNSLDVQEETYKDWAEANPDALITADMDHFYMSYYNKPYTMAMIDNPYGAFDAEVLDWMNHTFKNPFGLCGAGASRVEGQRFSGGYFMTMVGAAAIHRWVYTDFIVQESGNIYDKQQHIALREGFDDMRYISTLKKAIQNARDSGTKTDIADAAENFLETSYSVYSKSMKVMDYEPVEGYPGSGWGEYSFLDSWRNRIMQYLVDLSGDDVCGDGIHGILEDCNTCPGDVTCAKNEFCHPLSGCTPKSCSPLDTDGDCCVSAAEMHPFLDDLSGRGPRSIISAISEWKKGC